MEDDLRHYIGLLERGYAPEDALLVTVAKFPDFKHEGAKVEPQPMQQTTLATAPTTGDYNPYAPSQERPRPLDDFKTKGRKTWEVVQSKFEDMDLQRIRPSRKTTLIVSGVAGLLVLATLLLLLASQSGAAVEGTWMNDQGQRFTFRDDKSATWDNDANAQWMQNGQELVVVAQHGDSEFTHTLRIEMSDDGRAMWWMATSIVDKDGTEYTDAPGYAPTCSMLIKSDLASTLDKYRSNEGDFASKTPDWCEEYMD